MLWLGGVADMTVRKQSFPLFEISRPGSALDRTFEQADLGGYIAVAVNHN
jgi:hypothetical protein